MRSGRPALAVTLALLLAGCGARVQEPSPTVTANVADPVAARGVRPTTAAGAASCQTTAQAEFADIARRIYAQLTLGRNIASARRRVERSAALAAAVAARDRVATRATLRSLLRHQIQRIDVFDARGRRIAGIGHGPALAPVRGELRGAAGRVAGRIVMSVSSDRNYAGVVRRMTGAAMSISVGGRRVFASSRRPGAGYRTIAIGAMAYPSGSLQVALQTKALPPALCGARPAQTRINTVGFVGRRLLRAETSSHAVALTLAFAARDRAFRAAVGASDPAAIRRAIIVRFFRNGKYHIVRVRVTRGARLLQDVGGPYVLAPASATVRGPDGRVAGRFTLSVQDDTGYIKLMHRFTGAAVLLRTAAGTVPGSSVDPGPPSVPSSGVVGYNGRRYRVYTFTGTAFPSGPLQISLLMAA